MLEIELENLDGLDEAISALYVEKDGKFILDVAEHAKNETEDKDSIPRSRLNQEIDKRKDAEKQLTTLADELKKDVPEEMQDLVPDLPPGKLIKWLRDANTKGLFDPKAEKSLDTQRPGDKKASDFEGMSPQQIMATGYNTSKK